MKGKTKRLAESAILIAAALVLNNVLRIKVGAAGGSITLFSMLPLTLIAFRHGAPWGLLSGAAYGLLDMLTGFSGAGGTAWVVFGAALIDYVLAYGCMGLGGLFRGKIKDESIAYTCGSALAVLMRFVCHFISGFLVWGSLSADGFGAVVFSFTYNIGYMGPEMVTTIVGALVLSKAFTLAGPAIARRKGTAGKTN